MDIQNDNSARGVERMETVSNIFWHKNSHGKCPQCGRERDLGMVNDKFQDQFKDRCIDCCFGPPMEYWDMCDFCGQLYVGEHCDNPKCAEGSQALPPPSEAIKP